MEDVAGMLSFVATSIIHLMKNPVIGKYSSVFNNAVRVLFILLCYYNV
jgi:hypothetical protein